MSLDVIFVKHYSLYTREKNKRRPLVQNTPHEDNCR